jgi:hypothetical protein
MQSALVNLRVYCYLFCVPKESGNLRQPSHTVRRKMNPDGYCIANFGHGVGSA